jgi:hypothetical protein
VSVIERTPSRGCIRRTVGSSAIWCPPSTVWTAAILPLPAMRLTSAAVVASSIRSGWAVEERLHRVGHL